MWVCCACGVALTNVAEFLSLVENRDVTNPLAVKGRGFENSYLYQSLPINSSQLLSAILYIYLPFTYRSHYSGFDNSHFMLDEVLGTVCINTCIKKTASISKMLFFCFFHRFHFAPPIPPLSSGKYPTNKSHVPTEALAQRTPRTTISAICLGRTNQSLCQKATP